MDENSDSESSFEWLFESEDESQDFSLSTCSSVTNHNQEFSSANEEASTSANRHSNLINHFVGMGFRRNIVTKAVEEDGEGNMEAILETLLTYSEDVEHFSDKEKKVLQLVDMGFSANEASSAITVCGPDTSILELMDFMCASQMAKTPETCVQEPPYPISNDDEQGPSHKHGGLPVVKKGTNLFEVEDRWKEKVDSYRRKQKESKKNQERLRDDDLPTVGKRKNLFEAEDRWERKVHFCGRKQKESKKSQESLIVDESEVRIHIPKHMIGFGVPQEPNSFFRRALPEAAIGPPYFYYENVACTPKGVWSTVSRFLNEIEPEFVDSVHFCAAARKRGYVHNLPVHNRYPLQPIPPLTIQEAFPESKQWWPLWDHRTKFNCLNTCFASAKLAERVKRALDAWDETPPIRTQKYVLYECRKWNLLWTGKNRVAPLEPDELELLLGYPKDHTRGGGTSRGERYKALGNSFQVDTVGYHFSVLKNIFHNGITVLSLFTGIGGAEVALHRLGIRLKNVVSVEINKASRNILRSWWEQTNQRGNLIEFEDVQHLTADKIEQLIHSLGGFDLVVGGSPCNNLTGSNRYSRDGLQGMQSVLFYDYFRILETVRCIMKSS